MLNVLRLYWRIWKNPTATLQAVTTSTVYGFNDLDPRLTLAKKFFPNVRTIKDVASVPWSDILLRRIRVISVPGKRMMRSNSERWKRKLLKWLALSVSDEIAICSLHEQLFLCRKPTVLYAPALAVALIYQVHLPHVDVVEIKDENRPSRILPLYWFAKYASKSLKDTAAGTTVFTNPTTPWSIRAFRLLHPNRKIVIRYHDRLNGGLGGHGIKDKKVVKFVKALRDEGTLDEVESYYRADADALGGTYRPNGVNPDFVLSTDVPFRSALYSFAGGPAAVKDDSRLKPLLPVQEEILRRYPFASQWLGAKTSLLAVHWIPYAEFVRKSAQAEVCVDLFRIGQEEGFSYRIPEALWLNRKIITNRLIVRDEPFYSPDRIFLIGVDTVERLQTFIEKDIEPLPAEILKQYDSRLWWTDNDPVRKGENQ